MEYLSCKMPQERRVLWSDKFGRYLLGESQNAKILKALHNHAAKQTSLFDPVLPKIVDLLLKKNSIFNKSILTPQNWCSGGHI